MWQPYSSPYITLMIVIIVVFIGLIRFIVDFLLSPRTRQQRQLKREERARNKAV